MAPHQALNEIYATIDNLVKSLRDIAADLHPVMLEDLGLLPAIDHLIDDFSARYGIRVIRPIDQDAVNFNRQCRNHMFRIVQEGKATATPAKPGGERAQTTLSATLA